MELSKRIKELRKNKGLTQLELSKKSGISHRTIQRIENDEVVPVDLSVNRLNSLINNNKKYEYIIFDGLGHNNILQTFNYAVDWIKKNAINK